MGYGSELTLYALYVKIIDNILIRVNFIIPFFAVHK